MISSKTVKNALASLSDTERQLLFLLTKKEAEKEEVIDFLKHYDIESKSSVSTFLLNELLDRFQMQNGDDPSIPRIRGVADFYRFQNATAIMQKQGDEAILDADLVLKIRYPDQIRPFAASQGFLDRGSLTRIAGKSYADKVLKKLEPVKLHNKVYSIPEESILPDLIYLGLYRSSELKQNTCNTICYMYDAYRYCAGKKPGICLRMAILTKEMQHKAGQVIRWLLR
ncbi:MAG: hypothetical protein Q4F70_06020 [Clostridia bacterium]|nr:hypothetical protein [Clostridia bacterium]